MEEIMDFSKINFEGLPNGKYEIEIKDAESYYKIQTFETDNFPSSIDVNDLIGNKIFFDMNDKALTVMYIAKPNAGSKQITTRIL
jgi:hypothetical protein